MQQILNPNKAVSSTERTKEKGKKNSKDETEAAGTTMTTSEVPLHVLLVSPNKPTTGIRCTDQFLQIFFFPLNFICHIAHPHRHTQKWTKIYAINFTLPRFHISPQTAFTVDIQMCLTIVEADEQ